jgi:beta-galactosidase
MRLEHKTIGLLALVGLTALGVHAETETMSRNRERFCDAWQFNLGDLPGAEAPAFDDSTWRTLDLPHDWSIEQPFDPKMPGGPSVGYLPGGIGWYRKAFTIPESDRGRKVVIDFDGVYMDSQVWINGHLLGRRPNGYISFRYDLTPHLKHGGEENVIAVRVNVEPNFSRWYPGAGIYRRVWLTTMNPIHVAHWGTFVTTPDVSREKATVQLQVTVANEGKTAASDLFVQSVIYDAEGRAVAEASTAGDVGRASCPSTPRGEDGQDARPTEKGRKQVSGLCTVDQQFVVTNPRLWSPDTPDLYRVVSTVTAGGKTVDTYTTPLGIRTIEFTTDRGFFLNGEHVDIKGVCLHHDYGPIGTAFYPRALEWQLEILREMGCNAIRTAHNPRDPEFYHICDRMGFMVMDEAFDVWKASKLPNDYSLLFDEWHERDLTSMVRRDRNHPSIVIYSIGNEVNEQHQNRVEYPTQGGDIAKRLVEICKQHDPTRPITAACNHRGAAEKAGIVAPLDVYGQNYGLTQYEHFTRDKPVIGTENATSFITRGAYSYEIARDGGRIALAIQDLKDNRQCTGYGRFWGADRTDGTLVFMRNNPHIAGQFAWTGFEYLGECFPFGWPARNGLFGIIDLVGFPKDSYYAYRTEWTDEPTIHIVPQNWNWTHFRGQTIPVWVYSNSEEVELFLNGKSLGKKAINREESIRVEWDVQHQDGELKAVGLTGGQPVCTNIVRTPGEPARLELTADRAELAADGNDLSFIEVRLTDENGVVHPDADRMVHFEVEGAGVLFGVGNGYNFNHEPFKGNRVRTFHGLCRAIVKSTKRASQVTLKAKADDINAAEVSITVLPAGSPRLASAAAESDAKVRAHNRRYSRHRITGTPEVAASAGSDEVESAHPFSAAQETPATQSPLIVAPVFKHGPGQHADSVIVSRNKKPPMWSEADACRVIIDEAKRHGLELTVDGEKPRIEGLLATRDGKAASLPIGSPVTMTFDGISKDGKIVFEVLTAADVPAKTDNTDSITDCFGAAEQLADELKGKPGGYVVGLFYDPLLAKGTVPDEEPLRMQVRDFVEWLNEQSR